MILGAIGAYYVVGLLLVLIRMIHPTNFLDVVVVFVILPWFAPLIGIFSAIFDGDF